MIESMEQIRKRIKSVDISYKITKAMQLVATAKLKQIGKKVEQIKPYYTEVYQTFHQLIPKLEKSRFLLKDGQVTNKTLWVVFNSNLGLCAGFNNNLNKLVITQFKTDDAIYAIGNKARSYYKTRKIKINDFLNNLEMTSSYTDVQSIGLNILSKFNDNEFDSIKIAYTRYENSVTMTPTILDLVPIIKSSVNSDPQENLVITDFEPNPQTVMEQAIPLYISALLYGAFIESSVSEQASRRLAMENASNNANDMKKNLLINYNRARQGAITQEISEIIGGANAQE